LLTKTLKYIPVVSVKYFRQKRKITKSGDVRSNFWNVHYNIELIEISQLPLKITVCYCPTHHAVRFNYPTYLIFLACKIFCNLLWYGSFRLILYYIHCVHKNGSLFISPITLSKVMCYPAFSTEEKFGVAPCVWQKTDQYSYSLSYAIEMKTM